MAFAFDQDELGSPARIQNLVYLRQFCLRCIDCRCHSRFFILLYVPPIRWKPPQQNGIQPSSSKGVIFRHKSSRTNFKQIFQRHWLPGRTITCTVCCVHAVKFVNVDSRCVTSVHECLALFCLFPCYWYFLVFTYGEAPPERCTFFRPQVYERVGISLVEVYKRVGKSVIWACERTQKGWQMNFMDFESRENVLFSFVIDSYLKDSAFTEVKRKNKQGMWKGYHLSIGGVRQRYLFREKLYIKR